MLLALLLSCAKVPDAPTTQLPPCWSSPNCVSTQADPGDATHHIAPIDAPEGLDLDAVAGTVGDLEGCAVTATGATWVRAECTLPSGLFTDDLDVLLDGGKVHVRSSSRLGYDDLGVNRKRAEALFEALTAE